MTLTKGPDAVSPNGSSASPWKKPAVIEHPVAQHALTMLRNRQTTPQQFRSASNQLLMMLLTEVTRNLPTRIEVPSSGSESALGRVLVKPIVLLATARHGLGLAHRMAEFFPNLLVGALSFESSGGDRIPEARLHLSNAPALGDARVIIFAPIVATGSSSARAINHARRSGATDICLVSFVISSPGLTRVQTGAPELLVWTASIDSKLDARRGPLPGIGDFSERLFG